jgi:membrane protein YdbS with pleckstrin-like domain
METRTFKPSPQYAGKLYLNVSLVALAIALSGILLAWAIAQDEGPRVGRVVATWILLVNGAWWLVGLMLVGHYYRSLRYEVRNDEVIVYVGIWTKSVKHVPYRTVTNITTKRDIFDRWFFGIGSLNIQTAGMSGSKGAEEKLVGLTNVQEVYDIVATVLRRFRGSMSPTAAEMDEASVRGTTAVLAEILTEVRTIRQQSGK